MAISRDNSIIISGSSDSTIRLWEAATGICFRVIDCRDGMVNSIAISANNSIIISGCDSGLVTIWKTTTGQCVRLLRGHFSEVTGIAISDDASTILSSSRDTTIRIWESISGDYTFDDVLSVYRMRILQGHTDLVSSIVISADASMIFSGGNDRTVRIWEASTGNCVRVL